LLWLRRVELSGAKRSWFFAAIVIESRGGSILLPMIVNASRVRCRSLAGKNIAKQGLMWHFAGIAGICLGKTGPMTNAVAGRLNCEDPKGAWLSILFQVYGMTSTQLLRLACRAFLRSIRNV
jgi:hypothetical protein